MTEGAQILRELGVLRQMLHQVLAVRGVAWVREGMAREILGCGHTTFQMRHKARLRRKRIGGQWQYRLADIQKIVDEAATEIGGKVLKFEQPPQPMRRKAS